MNSKQNERRLRAKQRLEIQLKKGTKQELVTTESGSATWQNVPLSEQDVKRIKKEIGILADRTVANVES